MAATAPRPPAAATPWQARLAQWLQRHWQGPRPDAVARALQPLAWLYGGLAAADRQRWLRRTAAHQRAPVPVIVVGNLVAGGAGKTPTVIALLPLLRALGFTPGVVSRGHGRDGDALLPVQRGSRAAQVGDEPLLIHLRSGAPVTVGRDRAAAARALCAQYPQVDVLVADDGLQHHRLCRDLELLVFDDRGIGNGLLLPAGPLRQPLPEALHPVPVEPATLHSADAPPPQLVIYSNGRASTPLPGHLGQRRLAGVLPLADWWAGGLADGGWAALQGRPLLAAAGLARPQAFFDMLAAQGLQVQGLALPDHAPLDPLPWPADTADVVVTEKDAVKLPPPAAGRGNSDRSGDGSGHGRVWVATLDFQLPASFADALRHAVARWPRHRAPAPLAPG